MNRKKLVGKGIKERGAFITRSEIDKIYTRGYRQGVKDMAERIKNYYRHTTSKPLPATVEYYVDQIKKEMVEGG